MCKKKNLFIPTNFDVGFVWVFLFCVSARLYVFVFLCLFVPLVSEKCLSSSVRWKLGKCVLPHAAQDTKQPAPLTETSKTSCRSHVQKGKIQSCISK